MQTITIEPGKVKAFITVSNIMTANNIIGGPHDLWMDLEDYYTTYGSYDDITAERVAKICTDLDIAY